MSEEGKEGRHLGAWVTRVDCRAILDCAVCLLSVCLDCSLCKLLCGLQLRHEGTSETGHCSSIAAKTEVELRAPALAVWLTVDCGSSEQLAVAVVQLAHFSDAVSSESTASTRQTRDGIGESDRQSKAVGGSYDGNGAPGRGRRTEGQYALRSSTARVGSS